MPLALSLHNFIEKYNILLKPTEQVSDYLRQHPNLCKAALLVNHIFRAFAMTAFKFILPFSAPVSTAACFAGSLFYRLTVETNCAYKFALPAFAGSVAFPIAQSALSDVIGGIAFASISTLGATLVSLLPLTAYFVYIALTVSYDVDARG